MERGFASKWYASRQWPSVRDACARTRGAPTGPWGPYGAWLTRRSQATSGEQPRTISLLLGCRHNLLHRTLEIARTSKGLDIFFERNVVNSVSNRCNSIRISNDLPQPSLNPTATISRKNAITETHHCWCCLEQQSARRFPRLAFQTRARRGVARTSTHPGDHEKVRATCPGTSACRCRCRCRCRVRPANLCPARLRVVPGWGFSSSAPASRRPVVLVRSPYAHLCTVGSRGSKG